MQISMYAYCFNGLSFTLLIHKCSCDDLIGHPDSTFESNRTPFSWELRPSLEEHIARTLSKIEGITASVTHGKSLLLVTESDWQTLEAQVTDVLMRETSPDVLYKIGRAATRFYSNDRQLGILMDSPSDNADSVQHRGPKISAMDELDSLATRQSTDAATGSFLRHWGAQKQTPVQPWRDDPGYLFD